MDNLRGHVAKQSQEIQELHQLLLELQARQHAWEAVGRTQRMITLPKITMDQLFSAILVFGAMAYVAIMMK